MSKRETKDIHVDRETEKRLFSRMLKSEEPAHILLIQADGGLGKTSLLREFREMSQSFPTVFIDLAPHRASEDILFECCLRFGQATFSQFREVCLKIAGTAPGSAALQGEQRRELRRVLSEKFTLDELQVLCFDFDVSYDELSGNTKSSKAVALITLAERNNQLPELLELVKEYRPQELSGSSISSPQLELTQLLSTQVKTELSKMDHDQRRTSRRLLTAAFIDDLQQMHRDRRHSFVFLIDTYNEEIIAEVKEWVVDFLNRVRNYHWLIVVVAGRKFPSLPFDERDVCNKHVLLPFETKDIDQFAREMELPLEPDNLKLIFKGTKGVPLLLATILDNLSKEEANQ